MVIDDRIVVAGSFNYTGPANDYNDENLFVIGSPNVDLPERLGGPNDLAENKRLCDFFRRDPPHHQRPQRGVSTVGEGWSMNSGDAIKRGRQIVTNWFTERPARNFFILELLYLIGLIVLAVLYIKRNQFRGFIPDDPLNILRIAWFGALGAVSISLKGVFDHNTGWDPKWNYWHIARPLTGAVLGTIGYLIFVTAIAASTGDATEVGSGNNGVLIAYLIGFLVGYREQTFRELIKRLTDLILAPEGTDTEAPTSPTGLAATVNGTNVELTWEPSSDNVGVASYNVYRDATVLKSPKASPFTDKNVPVGDHTYAVSAIDAAGNESGQSETVTATIP